MIVTFQMPSKKNTNGIKLALKIVLTIICIGYIYDKVDFKKIAAVIAHSEPGWIALAILSFMVSKACSSLRLNIYFKNIDIHLPEWKNLQLYWLGMFYNLFLPGSIGGDAYKIVRLSKNYGVPYKKTAAAVLLDRFSGLAALGLLVALFWLVLFKGANFSGWIIIGMIAVLTFFYLATKLFFNYLLKGFWPTFAWGVVVQVMQVCAMLCLLRALHINSNFSEYILIFLVSSVMAVLPFTIGGLGARELVFIWGAQLFLLDNNISVTASALFYIVTVLSSSFGLPFIFLDPLQSSSQSSTAPAYDPSVQ